MAQIISVAQQAFLWLEPFKQCFQEAAHTKTLALHPHVQLHRPPTSLHWFWDSLGFWRTICWIDKSMSTGIEENYCISLDPWTSKQRLNTTNWPSLDSRHSPTPWSLMIQCSPPLLDKMLGEPGVIKHSQCFKSSPGSTSGKWSMVPGYSPPIPSKGWRYTNKELTVFDGNVSTLHPLTLLRFASM